MDGLSEDLTVLQHHVLGIDIDTAATASAVQNRRTDRAVGKLHRAVRVRRDLDRAAARLSGLSRHRTICHRKLVASGDLNVSRVAGAGTAKNGGD